MQARAFRLSKLGDLYRVGDDLTERDYTAAIAWYTRAAERGDASATNNLGSMYLNGMGVEQDSAVAATWYRKAAELGLAGAMFNLALRLLHGDGVEQDDGQTVEWLTRAAAQGHREATGQLGTLFRFGRGVEQNFVTAAGLHVKAAEAGDVVSIGNLASYTSDIEQQAFSGSLRAALSLAKMYTAGLGVAQDRVRGYAWLCWGQRYTIRDDDPKAREDEFELWLEYHAELSQAQRDQADALVEEMQRRSAAAA